MAIGIDTVDVLRFISLGRRFNGSGNIVDTADGRDDPDFIADAGTAIAPFIALEFVFFFTFPERTISFFRFIGIVK